jgi:hypothetical protein
MDVDMNWIYVCFCTYVNLIYVCNNNTLRILAGFVGIQLCMLKMRNVYIYIMYICVCMNICIKSFHIHVYMHMSRCLESCSCQDLGICWNHQLVATQRHCVWTIRDSSMKTHCLLVHSLASLRCVKSTCSSDIMCYPPSRKVEHDDHPKKTCRTHVHPQKMCKTWVFPQKMVKTNVKPLFNPRKTHRKPIEKLWECFVATHDSTCQERASGSHQAVGEVTEIGSLFMAQHSGKKSPK